MTSSYFGSIARRVAAPLATFISVMFLAVGLLVPATSFAATTYSIPAEAPAYLVNPSATGVNTLEAFVKTPGVTFATPGFTELDSGWSATTANPTYAAEYSATPSNYLTEDLAIAATAPSVTVDVYAFTGCTVQPGASCPSSDLTDAYQVTFNNGSYSGYTAMSGDPATDLAAENATPTPTTLYVNASSPSTGANGTLANPYPTIQGAVNAAQAGDTIEVEAGTYTENVTVPTPVTITGEAGSKLVVPDGSSSNGLDVTANNVTIQGLDIEGPATSSYTTYAWGSNVTRGIVIATGVTGFTITNDKIENLRNDILVDGLNSTGSITNNIIDNSKSGISVQYTDGTGVTISGNTQGTYGNDWGLNLHLNGHYVGTTYYSNTQKIAAIAPLSVQQQLLAYSTANAGWTVQDQGYSSANRTAVTVDTAGTSTGQGDPLGPLDTFQDGVNAVVTGGTVNVDAGTYTGDVTIATGNLTIKGTGLVTLNLGSGYGFDLDEPGNVATGFTMSGVMVNASPTTTYAFKAYKADGLTLTNDTFTGGAGNTGGGVDINTTSNVAFTNVTATGFYKNGFADTAAYTTADSSVSGNNIAFNNVITTNNGWAGIAFYTTGNAGGSASISGVNFTGTNTVSDNGVEGIFVEGDTDANLAANHTPANTVTTSGSSLNLADVAFIRNSTYDIVNYQTDPVNAIGASFDNITGDAMTSAQRTAEDAKIDDQLDHPSLGLVSYYTPIVPLAAPILVSPADSTVTNNPAFDDTWDPVTGAAAYEYQTSNDNTASNGVLSDIIYSDTSTTSANYDIEPALVTRSNNDGTPAGNYYWQVRAVDANGNPGAWSAINEVTYAPVVVAPSVPDAPTNLTAMFQYDSSDIASGSYLATTTEPGNNNLELLWDAPSGIVTGYQILSTYPDGTTNIGYQGPNTNGWLLPNGFGQHGDGAYSYQVVAVNAAGDSAPSATFTINYDATAPTVTVTPDTTNPLSGTVTFNISVNDAFPATTTNSSIYVYLYNDGGTQKHSGAKVDLSNGTGTFTVDTTLLDNGAATLDVGRLEDAAGNFSGTGDNYFSGYTIDNTVAPVTPTNPSVPTLETPINATTLATNNFTFTWDEATGGTAPISYQFQSSQNPTEVGGVLTNGLWASTTPTTSIISTGAPDGAWYWQVRSEDANGNFSAWSPIWSVTLSTTPVVVTPDTAPTASFVFPGTGPTATSFQVVFSKPVSSTDATNPANYFLTNWPGTAGSGPLTNNATVTYDSGSNTATVTLITPGWYISPEQTWGVTGVHDLAGTDINPDPTTAISTGSEVAPTAPGAPTTTTPTTSTSQDWTWTAATDPGDANASGIASYSYAVTNDADNSTTTPWTNLGNVTAVTTSLPVGSYTLHVEATDNAGNTGPEADGQVVVTTAGNTNTALTANAQTVNATEDTPLNITLTGAGGDGSALTYNVVSSTTTGTLSGTAPDLTYTPDASSTAADSFTFTVSDDNATSSPATVTISFGGTSGGGTGNTTPAPIANTNSITVSENSSSTPIQLSSNAQGTVSYSIVTPPGNGTLSAITVTGSTGSVSYTPKANYSGGDSFTYTATSGGETSTPVAVNITVDPVVPATPIAAAVTATSTDDAAVTITLAGTDTDAGATLTYATTSSPTSGTLSAVSGDSVTYTPNSGFSGIDSFTYAVNNGGEATSTNATVTINVTAATTTPVVTTFVPAFTSSGGGGGVAGQVFHTSLASGNTGSTGDNGGGQVLGASTYNFTKNLTVGSTGEDVTQLQTILIADGYLNIASPTGYFGLLTKAAVKEYQSTNNISPVSGFVGPITRALLNAGTLPTTPEKS